MFQNRFVIFLIVLILSYFSFSVAANFVNKDVERKIDLTTNIVRFNIKLEIENSASTPQQDYLISIPKVHDSNLAFLQARDIKEKKFLQVTKSDKTSESSTLYILKLLTPLASGESLKLRVKYGYIHAIKPYPAEITQSEHQLVLYTDNLYFTSNYETKSQSTEVRLASGVVISHTEDQTSRKNENIINYGTYSDKPANSFSELRLHYQADVIFATATHVERILEVSHWGNLAVEEHYQIRHEGSILKTGFSRLDYQRNPSVSAPSSFRSLHAELPGTAQDIYFRDVIGNISSSNVLQGRDGTLDVEFIPRIPLFGGWKTSFYIGYNLPLTGNHSFLSTDSKDSSHFVLNTLFGSPFNVLSIDELVVKVILPEGTSNIEAHIPFPVDSQHFEIMKTYLDTTGRNVLVIKKRNVVSEHNEYFQVTYNFSSGVGFLHEPFLLIGSFLVFFAACIFLNRFNLRISKNDAHDLELQASEILDSVITQQTKRQTSYNKIEASINQFLKDKDSKSFENSRKEQRVLLNDISNSITKSIDRLNSISKETSNRVAELERKEKERSTHLESIINASKTFVESRSSANKAQFEKDTAKFEALYDSVSDEILAIYNELSNQL